MGAIVLVKLVQAVRLLELAEKVELHNAPDPVTELRTEVLEMLLRVLETALLKGIVLEV